MRNSVPIIPLILIASMGGHRLTAQDAHMGSDSSSHDSAYARMQERGRMVMGIDQYTSTHRFEDLSDGGRITLVRNNADTAGAASIRQHLRAIAGAFAAGDFSSPMLVHMEEVPGTKTMAEKTAVIRYSVRPVARGGELTMHTTDSAAVRAIHEFLAFQRAAHRSPR